MKLVAPAIKRYRLTILGVILLISLGVLTYLVIPRQEDPLINPPGATVIVRYPGAGPRDVERFISRPVEEKINEMDNVEEVTSSSSGGSSVIMIQFDTDTDIDKNIQELREKIREVEGELPTESLDPEIIKWESRTISLMINLSGPFSYRELYSYAKYIRRDLEQIPGIMSLDIDGYQEREVHVEIDEKRLSQYKISLDEIVNNIRAENISLPGGNMDVGRRSYLIRTDEEFQTAEEIGRTMVGSEGGRPVYLNDLAAVKDTYERPEFMIRYNGRESINILVTQKSRSNLLSLSREVKKRLDGISEYLPPGLKIEIFADQALAVSERLSVFRNNLAMGAGLVVLVTLILMNARMAFVVAFIIPLSICFALIMLYQLGHTLNQITLASMVIVLGMLVDNGIVVVENIQRHLSLKKERLQAVLDGSSEVLGAITSSTITTVLAFTPLLFMSGDTGQFIRGIPLTMIFALTGSLMVAIFVSPLLSYRFLKGNKGNHSREGRTIRVYLGILQWSLNHKILTLGLILSTFIASLVFIPRLGLQFFPKAEKDIFIIEVSMPRGTNIQTTSALAGRIEGILMEREDVADVMVHIGGNGPKIYYNINFVRSKSQGRAQFFVTIKREREGITTSRVIKELRRLFNEIPGARIELMELEQGPPVGAPIAIKFKGDDLETLKKMALSYKSILESIPGAVDVTDNASVMVPQIKIRIDSEKARLLGITNAAIARTMRTAVFGVTAGSFRLEDEEVDVVVSLGKTSRNRIESVKGLYLSSSGGFKTPFSQVADLDLISDIGSIQREDLTRTVTVRSDVQGVLPENVVNALKLKTGSIPVPPGYLVEYEGETKERTESFISLGYAMIAALMLVYIVLVAQFNSYKQPFAIALSLPFGLVGAVLGLWITGHPFGFMAFLGVVSLTGIVVNDAIVLIDFINVLIKQGRSKREAVVEAGKIRFRPVMLTTVSTVGGLLPLAVRGGSLWGPMGNVIIFGLSMATLLTLILIPVMYEVLER
ncbi:efflux RND transporter permease subunit [Thermodesulfobacteriota bacterium]